MLWITVCLNVCALSWVMGPIVWIVSVLSTHRWCRMTNTSPDLWQQRLRAAVNQSPTPPRPAFAHSDPCVTNQRGVPGWECSGSLLQWRPRAGGIGSGVWDPCAPTVSYVWARPAGMRQSQPHPRPQSGTTSTPAQLSLWRKELMLAVVGRELHIYNCQGSRYFLYSSLICT